MEKIAYTTDNDEIINCFLGQQVLDNGVTLYLGFEQLTANNAQFWYDYYLQIDRHGEGCFLSNILQSYKGEIIEDRENHTEDCLAHGSLEDYDAFSNFVSSTYWSSEMPFYAPLFKKALSGFSSFSNLSGVEYLEREVCPILSLINAASPTNFIKPSTACEPRFMVYGSTDPITSETLKKHCDHPSRCKTNHKSRFGFAVDGFEHAYAYYQEIVISVPYATDKKTPAFGHFGFIKNPWHAVDPARLFARTGALLKGFSAYVSGIQSSILGNKHYLTIHSPLIGAIKTLAHALGKSNIHNCSEKWPSSTSGSKELLGESLLVLGPLSQERNAHWAIRDPDTDLLSDYFICSDDGFENHDLVQGRLMGLNVRLNDYNFIAVKRERLEIFYRASGKISDPDVMLRLLNHLKEHDQTGALPLGLATEIAHAYQSDGICAKTLTLDAAIEHYTNLKPAYSDLSVFSSDTSIPLTETHTKVVSENKP